jgi:uncharacterized delta-60 repeat protein
MFYFLWHKTRPANRTPSQRLSFRPRLEVLEDRCLLSAGVLDPTFGSGGSVTTSFGNNVKNTSAQVLVIQPDGKIVAAGDSENPTTLNVGYYDLARYNADGSLDATFGSKGEVQTKFNTRVSANAMALQPDGKILVAGAVRGTNLVAFEIVRYNSDGSLDSTFGNKGKVSTSFAQGVSEIQALDLETVGGVTKIVAAGDVFVGSGLAFGLARYNLNGSLDTSFGSGGEVVTNISTDSGVWNMAGVVQGDGKIVVAGAAVPGGGSSREFALARYNSDGTLDATFGSGGLVFTAIGAGTAGAGARAVALRSDGKIVAGGFGTTSANVKDFALARYNSDGSLDTSFGSGGIVLTSITGLSGANDTINGLAIQPANGQIIAVGSQFSSVLARYNPDGTLDATFGNGGIVAPTFGQGDTAVALQSDGKIVTTAINGNFGVARYLPSEPQIGSFTANPNPVTAGSSVTLTALNIVDANPSNTITQVAFYLDTNGDGKLDSGDTLLGYGTQTSSGTWTFTFSTTGWATGTYTLFAQAEDNYGVFGDPFAITLTVQ